jgi:hypothetical protein
MQRTIEYLRQLSPILLFLVMLQTAAGQSPVMETVFPAGGQVGHSVDVSIAGSNLETVQALQSNTLGVVCERIGPLRFRLTIPEKLMPGSYDLWAVGEKGISAPRTFTIGNLKELTENPPNDSAQSAMRISLNITMNGRMEKSGDMDFYQFHAKKGQRILMDCSAERIDSRLRAVLEVFDPSGRRLKVSRGYFGNDPLIDFTAPAEGDYILKVQDLTFSGSAEHIYRISIDTGPRVSFSVPSIVQKGKPCRIELYGWNLAKTVHDSHRNSLEQFDRIEIDIPEAMTHEVGDIPVLMKPAQAVLRGFAYHYPKSPSPLFIGLTDLPVIQDRMDNHSPASAQKLSCPIEVSGRLEAGDERDWYSVEMRRGEVFYFEAMAERIQSPVDLQIDLFDATGHQRLASFGDQISGTANSFPATHHDPTGRWVAPSDGLFLISVHDLAGGIKKDLRRIYQFSVRREEPDFQLLAVPHLPEPVGLNLARGGRLALDLIAFRQRGFDGEIRVSANSLPTGVEFPEVWLGPGVNQALGVISVDADTPLQLTELKLKGESSSLGYRKVQMGAIVRSGTPNGWGRIVSQAPMAITSDAPLRITADAHEPLKHQLYGTLKPRHSPGGAVDVAVTIERRNKGHQYPVKLIAAGLPELIVNQTSTIPADQFKGFLSFYLPPNLPIGRYSFVVEAETTIPTNDPKKPEKTVVYSNPVNIDVQPAAFVVEAEPFAVKRAKRGETIQIAYRSQRRNGFIGKMHTEIAMPGLITDVTGLRGRGETFVGQTSKGSIQIIVNDDAPLGKLQFLRLLTVGVMEDEPSYQGSSFLHLEIVE